MMEIIMAKRFKMSRGQSKRDFSRYGSMTHKRNLQRPGASRNPMRGGIRL